ncbi:hypothetical protein K0M31_012667 [Melipona bicolor]|uniref:Uncharacterized protein n=1 Tax=Melipona bicolor TaxID=60889 RepID=A0AA40FJK2_9HYME|nr:hypothetical protein K0M31_012667 [Melipona bicolor]
MHSGIGKQELDRSLTLRTASMLYMVLKYLYWSMYTSFIHRSLYSYPEAILPEVVLPVTLANEKE